MATLTFNIGLEGIENPKEISEEAAVVLGNLGCKGRVDHGLYEEGFNLKTVVIAAEIVRISDGMFGALNKELCKGHRIITFHLPLSDGSICGVWFGDEYEGERFDWDAEGFRMLHDCTEECGISFII